MPHPPSAPAREHEAEPYDGFGALLRDAYEAGPRRNVHLQAVERDDGFISWEDAYRYFTRPDEWIGAERRAVSLARGRVLDIGCAAGRHMLAMTGDREVLGIDPSAGAVSVAMAQGLDAYVGTVLEPGDVGTFDTLMLLGGNLGLLGSAEQAPDVLTSLENLARPGAQLLAIGHDPYMVPVPEHRRYHDRNRDQNRLPGQVRMRVRYKVWTSAWFDRLLVSPDELSQLVEGTSWKLEEATYSGEEAPGKVGFFLAELSLAK